MIQVLIEVSLSCPHIGNKRTCNMELKKPKEGRKEKKKS